MNSGDTAWVLVSTALVLFMTPGPAFFYAGMVRSKNVLGMLMQNYFAMGIVSVLWALLGFTIAFGGGGPLIGNLEFVGLPNVASLDGAIPGMAFVGFQMMIAVITPAHINAGMAAPAVVVVIGAGTGPSRCRRTTCR